jgi:hypothetical protein
LGTRRTLHRFPDPVICPVAAADRLVTAHYHAFATSAVFTPLAAPAPAAAAAPVGVLLRIVRDLAARLGFRERYTLHLFRVSCANHLAALGIAPAVIKHFLRWRSDAFMVYLRESCPTAAAIAGCFQPPDADLDWAPGL